MTHTARNRHRLPAVTALLVVGAVPLGLTACSAGPDAPTAKELTSRVGSACVGNASAQEPHGTDPRQDVPSATIQHVG